MITRIWHGKTSAKNAQHYLDFLLSDGTKEYRETDGNISAKVWRNIDKDRCDFWTVSEWRSIDSVKQFAGHDYDQAKYYPFDEGMLLEFEEHVMHYDLYDVSNSKIGKYLRQLDQQYYGGNWVGESFEGKLKNLKEEHVFLEPLPGVHSVAELIWHCIYWRRVTLDRIQGGKNKYRDETVAKYNFLPLEELKVKGWKAIWQELGETQIALRNILSQKNDMFLENEYEPGYSFEFLIEGTIQHDYYHLGQVGLVLKILKTKHEVF
jgi:uncharacterized damage-inducible protein DinB